MRFLSLFILLFAFSGGMSARAVECPFGDVQPGMGAWPSLRERYYVHGNPDNPISFGYELELLVSQNPNLHRFYRSVGVSEADWLAMSEDARRSSLLETVKNADFGAQVALKLSTAPAYLASAAIREHTGFDRIELSDNAITHDLREVRDQFQWLRQNLLISGVHGHAAYKREGTDLRGAEHFAKLDFDMTQAQTLAAGYRRFQETGNLPANHVVHWSTGPVDKETRDLLAYYASPERTGKEPLDPRVKYIYGVTLRPDLYGDGMIGHEVRSAVKRLPEALEKMRRIGESLQLQQFAAYRIPELGADPVLLSENVLKGLPYPEQAVYSTAADYLKRKHAGHPTGGAPYAVRFTWARLPWTEHPFIRLLPQNERQQFMDSLAYAEIAYQKEIDRLSARRNRPANGEAVTQALQVAMARWAHESQLAVYLKRGRELLPTAQKEAFYPHLGDYEPGRGRDGENSFFLGEGTFGRVSRVTSKTDAAKPPIAHKLYEDTEYGHSYAHVLENDVAALDMLREGHKSGALKLKIVEATRKGPSELEVQYVRGRELRSLLEDPSTSPALAARLRAIYLEHYAAVKAYLEKNYEVLDMKEGIEFGEPSLDAKVVHPETGKIIKFKIKVDNIVVSSSLIPDPGIERILEPSPTNPALIEVRASGHDEPIATFPLEMYLIDPF